MATLPLQSQMSLSTNYNATPRHRLVEFGDGYIQRTPLGLHHNRRNLTVTHEHLDSFDSNELLGFYESRLADADAIDISSNDLLGTAGKFYLESFDVQMTSPDTKTITATMIEVFDL